MNIHPKLIQDLEVFDKILPVVNSSYTSYGTIQLKRQLSAILTREQLIIKQHNIKTILANESLFNYVSNELSNIGNNEDCIKWLFNNDDSDLSFKREVLNSRTLLNFTNFMSVYTPSITVAIYLIVFLILRWYKVPVSITEYFESIYRTYVGVVENLMMLISHREYISNYFANVAAATYTVYQIYTTCMSVSRSYAHWKKCSEFKKSFKKIYYFIDSVYNISEADTIFGEKIKVKSDLDFLRQLISFDSTSDLGSCIIIKKNIQNYIGVFHNIVNYIGVFDSYISIVNMIKKFNFVIPRYDFDSMKPYIISKNMWNPLLGNNQTLNDFILGRKRMTIVTGANTSGKSTYMRNAMLSVYLAQTLGVSCCQEIQFTPFTFLFTYLNIPDSVGRESLFEAEMNRCMDLINSIKLLEGKQFAFSIIDELFTGTNPKEGIAGSFAVADYILNYSNSLFCITTHFHQITKLELMKPHLVENKKFDVVIRDDIIERPYVVSNGVSNQNIAVYLLEKNGFDPTLVQLAKFYSNI